MVYVMTEECAVW